MCPISNININWQEYSEDKHVRNDNNESWHICFCFQYILVTVRHVPSSFDWIVPSPQIAIKSDIWHSFHCWVSLSFMPFSFPLGLIKCTSSHANTDSAQLPKLWQLSQVNELTLIYCYWGKKVPVLFTCWCMHRPISAPLHSEFLQWFKDTWRYWVKKNILNFLT